MANYALSGEADADILKIARASVAEWGIDRAGVYILGLHDAFQRLADFPSLGRDAGDVREGYFRLEQESHVVFYRPSPSGVLIMLSCTSGWISPVI